MYEDGKPYLNLKGIRELLYSIGERPDEKTILRLFQEADLNGDGRLDLHVSVYVCVWVCFLLSSISRQGKRRNWNQLSHLVINAFFTIDITRLY